MDPSKENEHLGNHLTRIGSDISRARKQILAKYGENSMVRYFLEGWERLANNKSGKALNFPEQNQFEQLIYSMWRDTLKDGKERSLIGFQSEGVFHWCDVDVGDDMSAEHHRLSVDGKIVMRKPPQLFDIYSNPNIKLDSGKSAKITHDIHTHTAAGPNFYSQAELPGFERSLFARENGVFGVIACFGAYMAQGGSIETTKLYTLNPEGKFIFSLEDKAWRMLLDYYDDSFDYSTRKMFFKELSNS